MFTDGESEEKIRGGGHGNGRDHRHPETHVNEHVPRGVRALTCSVLSELSEAHQGSPTRCGVFERARVTTAAPVVTRARTRR